MINIFKKYIVILLATLLLTMTTVCHAAVTVPKPTPQAPQGEIMKQTSKINQMLGFAQYVGIALAIGVLTYLGIKYLLASVQEKADLKEKIVFYVVGALILGLAPTIVKVVFNLAESMF